MVNPRYAASRFLLPLLLTPLMAAHLLMVPATSAGAGPTETASPSDQSAILQQARKLLQKADDEPGAARQAAALLTPLAEAGPPSAEVSLLLAEAWYRVADAGQDMEKSYPLFEKAGHYAESALKADPQQWGGYYWLGLSELRKAQKVGGFLAYFITRNAIEDLQKVCGNEPEYDFGGAPRVLCHLYQVAPSWTPFGDIDRSIAYCQQAVQVAPDFALNHFYLAQSYLRANKKAAAVAQLRKVIALRPNPLVDQAREKLKSLGETAQ
jgi:hypothetical protein